MTSKPHPIVCADYEELCRKTAELMLETTEACVREKGSAFMVLTGGESPKGLYREMAGAVLGHYFPWTKMHFFLTDERYVPATHERSNYRMISNTLLNKAPIPSDRVHPIQTTDVTPEESARRYEKEIRAHLPLNAGGTPVFDLMLLGVGTDGHVASLFPDTDALKESTRLVVSVSVPHLPESRISLTMPLILAARHVILFISGKGKEHVLAELIRPSGKEHFPALTVLERSTTAHIITDLKTDFSAR